ncbi:MAG: right-handed parallel beta-helix repeat-containing protein, partial [Fluviicola sp.]|nr:right-handed parallel beta-helix repeat-containing protein [Fluviicola sp.]
MNKSILYLVFFIAIGFAFSFSGCKKPLQFSSGNLDFSRDTVIFDTVFTTIGSVTKRFKIYNNSNRTLNISQIQLIGGANSPFRINVDGMVGTDFAEIELEGKDSLFVFVEVTLDPNNNSNPMVIEDRIKFTTNGTDQFVELVAWGQDAYFHYNEKTTASSTTWANDKPHVIFNYFAIDSAHTLTIPAGTNIHLHKDAILFVYKGVLNINGALGNEVTLQGDRLEAFYDDVAGQYYGIYFNQALPSSINYAIIKNGIAGIHLYSEAPSNTGYTLQLSNTIIRNNSSYGLFIFQGAKVNAENCIIAKNGIHALAVIGGGDFNINHCHLLGYGIGDNVASAVGISNWYTNNLLMQTEISSINEGTITNSLIYGNIDNELAIDTIPDVSLTLNFNFENNLIKSSVIFGLPIFKPSNIWNQEPLLKDIPMNDFHFWSTSPLIDAGSSSFP